MTTTIEDPGAEDPGFGDPYPDGDIPSGGWSSDPDAGELLERAWGIIANAEDWDNEFNGPNEWTRAAVSFRVAYFQWIKDHGFVPEPAETDPPTDSG